MSGLLNFVKPTYYKNLFNRYVKWWGECTEKGKNTHIWTFLAFTSASNYWLFAYPKLKAVPVHERHHIAYHALEKENLHKFH